MRDPDVFLFDEPLSNLDAKLRVQMRTYMKKLHQRLGKTTIYVTHDQVEAMTLASRIAVMDNGHIRQFGPPGEIYEDPTDLFVAGFMGSPSMNIVRGRIGRNGGFSVEVADAEGSIGFPLPAALAPKVGERLGQVVGLGLRPEIITHPGAHAPGASVFEFERGIDVIEPTGPDTLVVFTLGGGEAIGRVRPDEAVEAGRPYRFQVNMDKAKLFDPATGNRL